MMVIDGIYLGGEIEIESKRREEIASAGNQDIKLPE